MTCWWIVLLEPASPGMGMGSSRGQHGVCRGFFRVQGEGWPLARCEDGPLADFSRGTGTPTASMMGTTGALTPPWSALLWVISPWSPAFSTRGALTAPAVP